MTSLQNKPSCYHTTRLHINSTSHTSQSRCRNCRDFDVTAMLSSVFLATECCKLRWPINVLERRRVVWSCISASTICLTKQWQSCVIMTTCYGTLVRSCIMCKDNCVSGTAGVCFPITQNFQVFFNGSVENNTYYFYNKAVWFVSLLFLLNLYNYNVVRFWLSTTMPFDCQTLSRGNQMAQLLERA